jgi:hypothetical protein
MSAWLTPAEVSEMTEATRRTTQCKRLAEMGVPFTPNYAGRPLVERAAALKYKAHTDKKPAEPDWKAIKAA